MNLAEVRAELLEQHVVIRAMMQDLKGVAEQIAGGAALGPELHAGVTRLARALLEHNDLEERWLKDATSAGGTPKPDRANAVCAEHEREHEELYAALVGISHTVLEFAGAGVTQLLDGVLAHMAREETSLLGEGFTPTDPPTRIGD